MAELARMTRSKSVDGSTRDGYFRLYSQCNKERNKDTRAEYDRQYYLRNKDKNATSKTAYARQYRFGNKDSKTEYDRLYSDCNSERAKYTRAEYARQYYNRNKLNNGKVSLLTAYQPPDHALRNKEKNVDYLNRHGEARMRYRIRNKEKVAESRRKYYHGDGVNLGAAVTRRLYYLGQKNKGRLYYLGRKEYEKFNAGYQRTWQSWKTPVAVRDYFESIFSRLNISTFDDWYRVSRKQMAQYGGLSLYNKYGSLGDALQHAYPEFQWNLDAFSHRGKKSDQRWLKLKIEELLPGIDIVEEYQHPDLNWAVDSDQKTELDLWIPQHRIGIEYQGEQHYYNIDSLGPSSAAGAYSERDNLKNSLCESQGITLIAIPYWWDGSMDSLSATLYQARPDVFPVSHGRPIPREMPVLPRRESVKQLGEDSLELSNIE